jgi:hypothetical protein
LCNDVHTMKCSALEQLCQLAMAAWRFVPPLKLVAFHADAMSYRQQMTLL